MIIVYYDGACEPRNPGGHGGFGCVIKENEQILYSFSGYYPASPNMSNNVAEYLGLTQALQWLLVNNRLKEEITFFGDNMMTVMQMDGKWRAKKGLYIPFYKRALAVRKNFKKLHFEWIPREENGEADELSKGELIKRKINFKIQPMEVS